MMMSADRSMKQCETFIIIYISYCRYKVQNRHENKVSLWLINDKTIIPFNGWHLEMITKSTSTYTPMTWIPFQNIWSLSFSNEPTAVWEKSYEKVALNINLQIVTRLICKSNVRLSKVYYLKRYGCAPATMKVIFTCTSI